MNQKNIDTSRLTLPDYRDNAEAYEIEERSRPDEMAMIIEASKLATAYIHTLTNVRVLDLCCGTGLSIEGIANEPNISEIVGVDISEPYLTFAKDKYSNLDGKCTFIQDDVVTVAIEENKWDVILMYSAYHHIENERKMEFLLKVKRCGKPKMLRPNSMLGTELFFIIRNNFSSNLCMLAHGVAMSKGGRRLSSQ